MAKDSAGMVRQLKEKLYSSLHLGMFSPGTNWSPGKTGESELISLLLREKRRIIQPDQVLYQVTLSVVGRFNTL